VGDARAQDTQFCFLGEALLHVEAAVDRILSLRTITRSPRGTHACERARNRYLINHAMRALSEEHACFIYEVCRVGENRADVADDGMDDGGILGNRLRVVTRKGLSSMYVAFDPGKILLTSVLRFVCAHSSSPSSCTCRVLSHRHRTAPPQPRQGRVPEGLQVAAVPASLLQASLRLGSDDADTGTAARTTTRKVALSDA